jgi:signal transduction histidine kinase
MSPWYASFRAVLSILRFHGRVEMPSVPPETPRLRPLRILLSSLKVKFIAALVLLASVVIGASTWWNLSIHREHMLASTEDKVRALAEAIDRGIQVAMRIGNTQEVQHILEEIARDPDIEQVMIFDPEGTIRRSSKPEMVGRKLDRDRLSRYIIQPDLSVRAHYEQGELIQSVVMRIKNRPECHVCHGAAQGPIATLHVDMSFRRTQEQIRQMEQGAVWTVVLIAAVLAGGGGFLMTRLVDRRVTDLVRAMARVETGDLTVRAVPAGQDELARLAESFNAMVDRLQAAREEIELYHRERLTRAERLAALGELAASLAHEIKNPLAGIAGAIGVMADELPASDPRREIMLEILDQVQRLNKTVQDLLTFARPARPALVPCDVHQILDRVLLLLAEDPSAKAVRVARAYRPGLPRVTADPKQLGQVFLNLLLNAVQAMPKGGQVTLTTRLLKAEGAGESLPADAAVEVSVADTGRGIPPGQLGEVFTPFFTTKSRGTGLGLAICRRIIEDHGGTIRVESTLGEGTTFRVQLPLRGAGPDRGVA